MMGGPAERALRVFFITEADPIYVYQFFETFLEEMAGAEVEVCGITVARAFHEPLTRTARRMLRFYGPLGFVRIGAAFALARVRRRSIARLAARRGIPEIPTASVNDPAYVARVRAIAPDVIISVAAPEIFRRDLLAAAPLCLNIHSGRLPRYRGMMPTFWQLLHGEPAVTITIHEMVEKLDAGRVLATATFPVRERDSLDRVIAATKREGARLMIRTLREVAAGTTSPQPLDMSQASYFSFPTPADVRTFRRRGHRLL